MARKVTQEDIIVFNEKYAVCHNYSQVARETGFSASTVSKYVKKDYVPRAELQVIRFEKEMMPEFSTNPFKGVENYGELCVLSKDEIDELKILWKELVC